jgi:hypothetical protein
MKTFESELRLLIRCQLIEAAANSDSGLGFKTIALGKSAQLLAQAFDAISMGAENFVTQCFVDFVGRRTKPLGAGDLNEDLKDCLRIIAADFKKHKRSTRGSWGDDRDYGRVAESQAYIDRFGGPSTGTYNMSKNMGKGSIMDSLTSSDPLNNIFNTLTHIKISISRDNLNFMDQYDFNPVVNILGADKASGSAKESSAFFKSEDNFYEFIRNAMDGKLRVKRSTGWEEVDFFSRAGIENLSRFYEGLFNYPGFGINITLSAESKFDSVS